MAEFSKVQVKPLLSLLLTSLLLASACGDDAAGPTDGQVGVDAVGGDAGSDSGVGSDAAPMDGSDAAPMDGGGPVDASDAGTLDAGDGDGGATDGMPSDLGLDDSGLDGGSVDAGQDDSGVDAGLDDAGTIIDGGLADSGAPDGGASGSCTSPPDPTMSFFVTEVGSGAQGGNIGGLAGADATCDAVANAAGIGGKTWRAYLSADDDVDFGRVDARDRIGAGPWFNYAGTNIGTNISIHNGGIPSIGILTECGRRIQFIDFDTPSGFHDILTGTFADGTMATYFDPNAGVDVPATCGDWRSSASNIYGWVGHSDSGAGTNTWNDAHVTFGCSEGDLASSAGNGRLYCFATN